MTYPSLRRVADVRLARWLASGMTAWVALAASEACDARVVLGASSAYSQLIQLDLTRTTALPGGGTTESHQVFSSGPLPTSAGVAPDPYDTFSSVASTSVSFDFFSSLAGGRFLDASTGRLLSNAYSYVDGAAGDRAAFSLSDAYEAAFAFLGNLIAFDADTVSVGAGVTGDYGSLLSGGVTVLRNAEIELIGTGRHALPSGPEADTHVDLFDLWGFVGVSLVLNEQLHYGDGVGTMGIGVNGVHLHFDNFVIDPSPEDSLVLNGDFIIGHTEAELRVVPDIPSVPEPGMPALVAAGLAAVALRTRARTIVGCRGPGARRAARGVLVVMHRATRFVAALALLCAGAVQAGPYRITTMDLPGGAAALGWDINNSGVFVGSGASGGVAVGYVVDASGAPTILSGPSGSMGTSAFGISDGGTVVGRYVYPDPISGALTLSGFIYGAGGGGSYETLNYAGSAYTELRGISPNGKYVTGFALMPSGEARTFVFDRIALRFIDILVDSVLNIAQGVTDAGLVVGDRMSSSSGRSVGFTYDIRTGTLTDFAIPGASDVVFRGINASGQIDGYLFDDAGQEHGFVVGVASAELFDVPGSVFTMLEGINDAGWLAGTYIDAAGLTHAFLATPVSEVSAPPAMWLLSIAAAGALGTTRRRLRPVRRYAPSMQCE